MTPQSQELGRFLKRKRQQLTPSDVDLPSIGRRRTPGLRREEVCLLSGVGMTWYTWLEQGRAVNPSAQVVDALARTLRLDDAEADYVRRLLVGGPSELNIPAGIPEHGQHVLDAFGAAPAFAIARDWSIVGWNASYGRFFPWIDELAPVDRNLLWLLWTHADVRGLLVDWDADVRRFTATFRASVSGQLHARPVLALIERLTAASAEFAAVWADHGIERFTSRERDFQHPAVGRLTLQAHQLTLDDAPDIRLVVYTARPGSPSADGLRRLG